MYGRKKDEFPSKREIETIESEIGTPNKKKARPKQKKHTSSKAPDEKPLRERMLEHVAAHPGVSLHKLTAIFCDEESGPLPEEFHDTMLEMEKNGDIHARKALGDNSSPHYIYYHPGHPDDKVKKTEEWVVDHIATNPGQTQQQVRAAMIDTKTRCPLPLMNDHDFTDMLDRLTNSGRLAPLKKFGKHSEDVAQMCGYDTLAYYVPGAEPPPVQTIDDDEIRDFANFFMTPTQCIRHTDRIETKQQSESDARPVHSLATPTQRIETKQQRPAVIVFDARVGEDGRITIPEATREIHDLCGKILTLQVLSKFEPKRERKEGPPVLTHAIEEHVAKNPGISRDELLVYFTKMDAYWRDAAVPDDVVNGAIDTLSDQGRIRFEHASRNKVYCYIDDKEGEN